MADHNTDSSITQTPLAYSPVATDSKSTNPFQNHMDSPVTPTSPPPPPFGPPTAVVNNVTDMKQPVATAVATAPQVGSAVPIPQPVPAAATNHRNVPPPPPPAPTTRRGARKANRNARRNPEPNQGQPQTVYYDAEGNVISTTTTSSGGNDAGMRGAATAGGILAIPCLLWFCFPFWPILACLSIGACAGAAAAEDIRRRNR